MQRTAHSAASISSVGTLARSSVAAAVAMLLAQANAVAGPETSEARAARPAQMSLAQTDTARVIDFDIEPQPMSEALTKLGEQAGLTIIVETRVSQGIEAAALSGRYTADEALKALLEPAGLKAEYLDSRTVAVRRASEANRHTTRAAQDPSVIRLAQNPQTGEERDSAKEADTVDEILVTGTRIRGAATTSPVLVLDEARVREEGHRDLGDVIRSLSQNYSGGQNPAIARGASSGAGGIANQNINSGSALNLRGLGPDATLTLLNGKRLPYSGFSNAVDVSMIPIAALSRIEVISDGASAVYGSDAVAGVANIITKRDFEGVTASYQIGAATEGGGTERRYGLTTGSVWNGGGFIVSYEHLDADGIRAEQRPYLQYMLDPHSILPERRQRSVFGSLHQDIGRLVTFDTDLVYLRRDSGPDAEMLPWGLSTYDSAVDSVTLTPTIRLLLPADWSLSLRGGYSRDKTHTEDRSFDDTGSLDYVQFGCYCNDSRSLEIGGEGPVFDSSRGEVRMAVGAGYRNNQFDAPWSGTDTGYFGGELSSRFAYAELLVPVVSPAMGVALAEHLNFTAALRHEDYGRTGRVTTPKLGFMLQPNGDLTFKGSWGKSYKEPTLLQRFRPMNLGLFPAAFMGASGYPEEADVLMTFGGNPDLRPERATSWTGTLQFHPQRIPGLRLEASYFDIDYSDRVAYPVTNFSASFRDPAYADFILLDPSLEEQERLLALTPFFGNATPDPYDPQQVIGILYNQYVNLSRQDSKGLDVSGSYSLPLAGGNLQFRGSASWLRGRQQNAAGQPELDVTGFVFYPPKFRSRVGAVWSDERLLLASFVNYTGSIVDNQRALANDLGSSTTVDFNASYGFRGDGGTPSGLELSLSMQNVLNSEPPKFEPLLPNRVNYDSTNHSAIGRFVSFSISKHW